MRGRPAGSKDKDKRSRGWTCAQLKFLRENYYKMDNRELAKHLCKSLASVRSAAEECKLKKKDIGSFDRYSFEDFINKYGDTKGVYCIVNDKNRKKYIGCSDNIGQRVGKHFVDLQNNKHENKYLQKEWDYKIFRVGVLYIGDDYQNVEQDLLQNTVDSILYNININNIMPILSFEQQERFWNRIDIKSINECWEWKAYIKKDGYGTIGIGKKDYASHRISYYLTYNKDPNGMYVMHKCNNKKCCNPFHLELGTCSTNAKDAHRDGLCKTSYCEDHYSTYITNKECLEIVDMIKGGIACNKIAKQYNIKNNVVYSIKHGRSWNTIVPQEDIIEMKKIDHYNKTRTFLDKKKDRESKPKRCKKDIRGLLESNNDIFWIIKEYNVTIEYLMDLSEKIIKQKMPKKSKRQVYSNEIFIKGHGIYLGNLKKIEEYLLLGKDIYRILKDYRITLEDLTNIADYVHKKYRGV
jgi:uncharacterized protein (DUF433 family)